MKRWRRGVCVVGVGVCAWVTAACHGQQGAAREGGAEGMARGGAAASGVAVLERAAAGLETKAGGKKGGALAIARDEGLEFDSSVPTVRQVVGIEIGDRPIRHGEMEAYFGKLAEVSPRVRRVEYGRTHEGRALYYLVVTDPANHAKMEAIRSGIGKLADPRTTNELEAAGIVDQSPAIAWMAYSVHGDELSGADGAVLLAYRLAAGKDELTGSLLANLVVCIDAMQNPDGRERFLGMMQQIGGRIATGDTQSEEHAARWPWGRTNHYLFDLNRDWYLTVQPESKAKTAAIASWHPQLLVDGHEMGSTDTYLFSPPEDPINPHAPPGLMPWMWTYSNNQAAAFDQFGWSYYRGEWNEGWAIGFADIWALHHGAVGILYEQARSAGSLVRMPTGEDRYYAEDVAHQYVSSVSNLKTLSENRKAILGDFYGIKKRAVADERVAADAPTSGTAAATSEAGAGANEDVGAAEAAKGRRDVFLMVPGRNRSREAEFAAMLQRQGIEMGELKSSDDAMLDDAVNIWGESRAGKAFPAGTVVVSMRQPLSPLARSLLDFDPRPSDEFLKRERRELELHGNSNLYDVSSWCAAMCYDVDGYWARGAERLAGMAMRAVDVAGMGGASVASSQLATAASKPAAAASRLYGVLIDGDDDASIRCMGRLLQAGWKVRCANKPFTHQGRPYPAGSFLIRMHENAAAAAKNDMVEALGKLPASLCTFVETGRSDAGPYLGGGEFRLLQEPRVALAGADPFSSNGYGAAWHLLDFEAGLRISRLDGARIGFYDLRKYNVLILPDGGGGVDRILNEGTTKQLETWVRGGGTLIAVGGSAAALARPRGGLSEARVREDVLDKLDEYAEATWRQRAATQPSVDAGQVWEFKPEKGFSTSRPAEEKKKPDELEGLKRQDRWARRFMPFGVFVGAELRPESWLRNGVGERLPVMLVDSTVLLAPESVEVTARFLPAERLRLSGLLWPEARERLADSAYLTRESLGRGQIILFSSDPVFRGFAQGTARLFLNAVILGPGCGADAPLPW